MIAYKLFRLRKNGSLGSLFINRKQVLEPGVLYGAEEHRTKGYKFRPFWHCLKSPSAPHLTKNGRVWYTVEMSDFQVIERPIKQGGVWFLANQIMILTPL